MPEIKDQGSIPQGLIEQARAKDVDPGKLQYLGKQAAALYSDKGMPLNDAVLNAIGDEQLGPEHTRRVCEFANQAAFQNEWEKGGSVRNVEFEGGPADPAFVLREMHDGARPVEVQVSDYDSAPMKTARADHRVEEEIFGKYAHSQPHPSEIPDPGPEMHQLRQTVRGVGDHFQSEMSKVATEKILAAQRLGNSACDAFLSGSSLYKIADAWSHYCSDQKIMDEALQQATDTMIARGVPRSAFELEREKLASEKVGKIPNPAHPLIQDFVAFSKLASQYRVLRRAVGIVDEQIPAIDEVLIRGKMPEKTASLPTVSPWLMGALHGMRGESR